MHRVRDTPGCRVLLVFVFVEACMIGPPVSVLWPSSSPSDPPNCQMIGSGLWPPMIDAGWGRCHFRPPMGPHEEHRFSERVERAPRRFRPLRYAADASVRCWLGDLKKTSLRSPRALRRPLPTTTPPKAATSVVLYGPPRSAALPLRLTKIK
jgi:hypothetical protein